MTTTATEPKKYLRQVEICRRLSISDETWRRWRQAGLAPLPVDLPGRPRWLVSEIDAFERGHRGGHRVFFGTATRRRRG